MRIHIVHAATQFVIVIVQTSHRAVPIHALARLPSYAPGSSTSPPDIGACQSTNKEAVDMLNVFLPSPPVPTMSMGKTR